MNEEQLKALLDKWSTKIESMPNGQPEKVSYVMLFEELLDDFSAVINAFRQYQKDLYIESSGEYYRRQKDQNDG